MNRLEGKVAFVTGAGGGVGSAVCQRFLDEGARVVAVDIDIDKATASVKDALAEGRAIALKCDVSQPDEVEAAIAQAVATFGSLNVLCSPHGGSSTRDGRVTEAALEEFWRVIGVDLFGTLLVSRFGIPHLEEAGGGSVINFASIVGLMAISERDFYTAAKGGIISSTRSIAAGYAATGIRVNAIAPGLTLSPRVAARASTERSKKLQDRHLLGVLQPVDIAEMAVYLASDESKRVTGQVLTVDSGITIT
ncbi:SDR family NAD(P)-dependent oxidoreductase [Microbacterium pygmaeum]|uniref:NAD(P)-dependent dehydrogenase, short-chain alcohol dehydrogenase family n=1 Tax=Microbacterium pygmaeum TaxID=370764 RepID=A0A1G7XK70_9MICO|nr:SDR family oxidoreductase [Microbacterium pygmaeum]SDG84463.1 NAD(P)-dependent dehydrogenase, short-chain alcohol dehydrogenase family [Microbacterium pygmaeum]